MGVVVGRRWRFLFLVAPLALAVVFIFGSAIGACHLCEAVSCRRFIRTMHSFCRPFAVGRGFHYSSSSVHS